MRILGNQLIFQIRNLRSFVNWKFKEFPKLENKKIPRILQFEKLTNFTEFSDFSKFSMWKTIEIPKIGKFFRNYLNTQNI